MTHLRSSRLILFVVVIICLILSACSNLEAARYQRQAEQFLVEGKLPEAVLTYRQALASDPENPEILRGLGMALAAQGRQRSAARFLGRAIEIDPNDTSAKDALASLTTRPQNGLSLQLAWIVEASESEPVGAAVASGRIFVVYTDGQLTALDQATGQVMWKTKAPVGLVSPPSADSGQVWVGAEDGTIYIYDAKSGDQLGAFATGGAVYAAPALTSDTAYCPSNDGKLYAMNRATVEMKWKAEVGEALHVSPLVSGQAIYVGSVNGRLYGFNASTGERLWAYGILTQGAVESIPTLVNERLFFGSGDGRVYALDAETGGEYWRFSTPDAVYAQPLVWNDQIIVASSGQMLASVQFADGSPTWSLSFDGPITGTPVLFKGRLFLFTRGNPRLFAVDPQTGKLLGELNTGDWLTFNPLVAGDDIILIGQDGSVLLYR